MHDLLFASAPDLSPETLEAHAKKLKLDMPRFKAAIGGDTHKAKVDEDFGLFNAKGFRGVPAFIVGEKNVNGAQPLDKVVAAANAQLGGAPGGAAPSDSPSWGAKKPVVTVEWFGDYQSPWNERGAPTIAELEAAFPGKVRFVWRAFPLPMFEHARDAQNAVLEAAAQGKFMAMHKLLAANSRKLTRAEIAEYAKQAGLDVAKVESAMSSDRYAAQIDRDIADGKKRGVTGVPAFMIGDKQMAGSQPLESFKTAVQAAMK
jgi:protein-disulfide isomerase